MSRLTEARARLASVRSALGRHLPQYIPDVDHVQLALQRMAQLEKVAELARAAVEAELGTDASGPVRLLELGLVELDNHPDTRERAECTGCLTGADLGAPPEYSGVIAHARADCPLHGDAAQRLLAALDSPSAEAAARRAWDSWRDQRGPGVTEAP